MATPTITFNDASGSDTAASGAGPATALSGTSASYSGSVFTLDGSPDLSGVATDGSHLIWVQTSTGRQFFTINAANDGADTVTVDDAPAGTSTGLTWGLGGKRNNIGETNSVLLFTADAKAGWTIELEDNQSISSAITLGVSGSSTGKITLRSSSAGTTRTITQSANAAVISMARDYWTFQDIGFENTNGSKSAAYGILITGNSDALFVINCEFGDSTNTLQSGIFKSGGTPYIQVLGGSAHHCVGDGIDLLASLMTCHIDSFSSHDNGGKGIDISNGATQLAITNCVIVDNTSDGIGLTRASSWFSGNTIVSGNTIDNNGGDGIDFTGSHLTMVASMACINNIITNNGGYGVNGLSGSDDVVGIFDYNNFGTGGTANTSGATNNITGGSNDLALDPQFTDSSNDDFSVGANMKATAFPSSFMQGSTTTAVDMGAVQREEPAGGGGGTTVSQGLHSIESGITA